MKYIFAIGFFLVSSLALSADIKSVTGTISKVQLMSKSYKAYSTKGEAIAFIHMKELPLSCGNTGNYRRVAITSEHPAYNVVVSASLAAKAANQTVKMYYVESCTLWNNNAWDFSIMNVL